MSDQLVNVGSVIGKEILNLEDGSFLGKVQGVFVEAKQRQIVGIQVRQKGLLGSKNIIPFANIKYFGSHTVTVNHLEGVMAIEGRNILAMPVVTVDGTIVGKVLDFAFDPTDGQVVEYVLKGGLMEDIFDDEGIIAGDKIIAIGKDVIIAVENLSDSDFRPPNEEIYGDWQAVDDIISNLDEDEAISADEEEIKEVLYEEQFDEITNKITKTIGEVTDKIKKEVVSEEFGDKIKVQADRLGEEAKGLINMMMDKLQQTKLDPEAIKQDLKTKMANNKSGKKDDNEDVLASQIVEQLKGASVEKPLLDVEGNVIVWPGQLIGNEEVKLAIKAGKLQELISLTVQLVPEEQDIDGKEAEEAQKEGIVIEPVEVINQEDTIVDDHKEQ